MATSISTEKDFRRRQKVVAAVDLPGVPAGTFGKVWFVSGVTWIRYHVAFENGVEIANVDGGDIRDRKSYLAEQAAAEQEAARRRARGRARAPARRAPGEPRRRPRRPLSPEHTMKLGMQIDYAGGFKESAAKVSAYEKAGLDMAWVAEAYGFDGPTLHGLPGGHDRHDHHRLGHPARSTPARPRCWP